MCRKLLIDGTVCICYTEFTYSNSRPAGHLFPFMKACTKDKDVTVHTPLSREVLWHEYAKIPRHTSQNSIAAGKLE